MQKTLLILQHFQNWLRGAEKQIDEVDPDGGGKILNITMRMVACNRTVI